MKKYEYERAVVSLNPHNSRHRYVLDELMKAKEQGIKTTEYFVNVVLELKAIKEGMKWQSENAHFDWLMANREYIKALLFGENSAPIKHQAFDDDISGHSEDIGVIPERMSLKQAAEESLVQKKTELGDAGKNDKEKRRTDDVQEFDDEEDENTDQTPSIGSKLQSLLV